MWEDHTRSWSGSAGSRGLITHSSMDGGDWRLLKFFIHLYRRVYVIVVISCAREGRGQKCVVSTKSYGRFFHWFRSS